MGFQGAFRAIPFGAGLLAFGLKAFGFSRSSIPIAERFYRSPYERRRLLRVEAIAVTAQSSHAGGSPMSQRECAGFSWPPEAVRAGEPLGVGPEPANR